MGSAAFLNLTVCSFERYVMASRATGTELWEIFSLQRMDTRGSVRGVGTRWCLAAAIRYYPSAWRCRDLGPMRPSTMNRHGYAGTAAATIGNSSMSLKGSQTAMPTSQRPTAMMSLEHLMERIRGDLRNAAPRARAKQFPSKHTGWSLYRVVNVRRLDRRSTWTWWRNLAPALRSVAHRSGPGLASE